MNVYDFDGTIYKNDSTVDFFVYLMKKKPIVLKCLLNFFVDAIKYKLKCIDKTKMKETFYSHLLLLKNNEVDKLVLDFWRYNKKNIFDWYLKQKKTNDVVISASPRYILKPICDELGVGKLICSEVDKNTGKYDGINCYGEEKVNRFYKKYKNGIIDNFYSDSYSDEPLAKIAKKAFIVKKDGTIIPWDFERN